MVKLLRIILLIWAIKMRFIDYICEDVSRVKYHSISINPNNNSNGVLLNILKRIFGSDYTQNSYMPTMILNDVNIKNMKGCPVNVDKISLEYCQKLETLEGISPNISEMLILSELKALKSYKGIKRVNLLKVDTKNSIIKSVKPLWEADINDISLIYDNDKSDLSLAMRILQMHIRENEKNYMKVIKTAREYGVEDYFK